MLCCSDADEAKTVRRRCASAGAALVQPSRLVHHGWVVTARPGKNTIDGASGVAPRGKGREQVRFAYRDAHMGPVDDRAAREMQTRSQ